MSSYERGLEGEKLACAYLESIGIRVISRRYRADGGEVDIIGQQGRTLHFVEVKYRPDSRLGAGLMNIDQNKRRRLFSASKAYLKKNKPGLPWQIDYLEITRAGVRLILDTARQRQE